MKILQDLLNLLQNPEHWTRGVNARDNEEKRVEFDSDKAVKWCLLGGLFLVGDSDKKIRRYLETFLPKGILLQAFNDNPSTKHTDIISLINTAINNYENALAKNPISY